MPGLAMLKALWAYRNFIWSSVLREFHGKYRESLLGAFWSVANPLAMIVIYTVVFGQLMRPKLAGHEETRGSIGHGIQNAPCPADHDNRRTRVLSPRLSHCRSEERQRVPYR